MRKPIVSVIMLTHNREKYVSRAIESILDQTFNGFEFIIIDNASSDDSGRIVQNYQKLDSRIHFYKRKDCNIGSGRNFGIDHAQGTYFTFIDDDDYCNNDYLEFLLELAETYNADISVCGSCYDTDGIIKPKYVFDELVLCDREEAVANLLLRKYFNNGNTTKLFRKTPKISRIRYQENSKYDDIYTMYKFFIAVNERPNVVVAKGEPKYIVCRHVSNNSIGVQDFSKLTPEWINEYLLVYHERTKYIENQMPSLNKLEK